jgi:UDP-3-O-[3-hydroxymyristoyl] glucosamine N-acyltransferase
MAKTVGELARIVAGTVYGDPNRAVSNAAPIETAGPESITFISDAKKTNELAASKAAAVIVPNAVAPASYPEHLSIIVVADPLGAMCVIAETFSPPAARPKPGIHPAAVVDDSATIGPGASIGPFAVVEANVVIGANVVIHSHAVVRERSTIGAGTEIHAHAVVFPRTEIGERCIIFSGAVLGRDGFGFRMVNGVHKRIPQLGGLRLGNDVEIGANTTIDCATFGWTVIGDGTKIDNQVMIGHNCSIGRHNIIVGHVGISGSSKTGDYCVFAGKVGIADHVTIGNQVMIGAGAGVHADLPGPARYMAGVPCMPESQALRVGICITQLPELRNRIRALERKVEAPSQDAEPVRKAG